MVLPGRIDVFYSDIRLQTSDYFSGRKGKGAGAKWEIEIMIK